MVVLTVKMVDYHSDKHLGVNLSRECDKQVSVPAFRDASSHARPIFTPH